MSESDAPVLELRVAARPSELGPVRDQIRKCVTDAGADPECATDIVMAVDEALQNIIRHAYGGKEGAIEITIERRGPELVFSLRDYAPEVDPARMRGRDLDDVRPGGIGTHLIRQAMDRTELVRPPSGPGNLLRMVKRIG